jgi:hypothetical protein
VLCTSASMEPPRLLPVHQCFVGKLLGSCCGGACRSVRVRALVQLGQLSEASQALISLVSGKQLPDPVMDTPLVVKSGDGVPLKVMTCCAQAQCLHR